MYFIEDLLSRSWTSGNGNLAILEDKGRRLL